MQRTESPEPVTALRLLPWLSPEGKPCYLLPGGEGEGGYVSRLADAAEVRQLATGAEVLRDARRVLDDPMSPYTEVRYAALRLTECLGDALRVAESRGMRLPVPDVGEAGDSGTEGAEPDEPGVTGTRVRGEGRPHCPGAVFVRPPRPGSGDPGARQRVIGIALSVCALLDLPVRGLTV